MNDTLFNAASASGPKLDPRKVRFPYVVHVGNVNLSIHPYIKKKGEQNYTCYRFCWRDSHNRRKTMESEMKRLLDNSGLPMLLFLVVCGFGGLRHSEAVRLDITGVCLKESVIKIRASRTKKKVRRVVPIMKLLKSWLKWLLPQRMGWSALTLGMLNSPKTACPRRAPCSPSAAPAPVRTWDTTCG